MRKIDTKVVNDCRECPYGYYYEFSPATCPFDALGKCVETVFQSDNTSSGIIELTNEIGSTTDMQIKLNAMDKNKHD